MTSSQSFSANDLPSEDFDGNIIHYELGTGDEVLNRAVLRSDSHPVVHWQQLMDALDFGIPAINHVIYFVPKDFAATTQQEVQQSLELAFSLAFPDQEPATVKVRFGCRNKTYGCYVSFDTPSGNVPADRIVAAAHYREWKADGHPLGRPFHVGIQ